MTTKTEKTMRTVQIKQHGQWGACVSVSTEELRALYRNPDVEGVREIAAVPEKTLEQLRQDMDAARDAWDNEPESVGSVNELVAYETFCAARHAYVLRCLQGLPRGEKQ